MMIDAVEYDEELNTIWLDGEELSATEAKRLIGKLETAVEQYDHEQLEVHEDR